MNLKEAFRYQNVLTEWMLFVLVHTGQTQNVVKTTQKHLRSAANSNAKDEEILVKSGQEYPYSVMDMVGLGKKILDEKIKLTEAISLAKRNARVDLDAAVASNKDRQNFIKRLETLSRIKPYERTTRGAGHMINNEGNQVQYVYDIEEHTEIDFDRNAVRDMARALAKESEDVSSTLDTMMLDVKVEIKPTFDMMDTIDEVMEKELTAKT